jgi:hypothetical protein
MPSNGAAIVIARPPSPIAARMPESEPDSPLPPQHHRPVSALSPTTRHDPERIRDALPRRSVQLPDPEDAFSTSPVVSPRDTHRQNSLRNRRGSSKSDVNHVRILELPALLTTSFYLTSPLQSARSSPSPDSSRRASSIYQAEPSSTEIPPRQAARPHRSIARVAGLAQRVETRLDRLAARYQDLQEENARLRAETLQTPSLRERLTATEAQLATVVEQNQSLVAANQFLQHSVGELIEESEELKRAHAAAMQECSVLHATLAAARAEHEEEVRAWHEERLEALQRSPAPSPLAIGSDSSCSPRVASLDRGDTMRRPRDIGRRTQSMRSVERARLLSQETLLRGLLEMDQLRAWRCLLQLHAADHKRAVRRTNEATKVSEALQVSLPWSSRPSTPRAGTDDSTPSRHATMPRFRVPSLALHSARGTRTSISTPRSGSVTRPSRPKPSPRASTARDYTPPSP